MEFFHTLGEKVGQKEKKQGCTDCATGTQISKQSPGRKSEVSWQSPFLRLSVIFGHFHGATSGKNCHPFRGVQAPLLWRRDVLEFIAHGLHAEALTLHLTTGRRSETTRFSHPSESWGGKLPFDPSIFEMIHQFITSCSPCIGVVSLSSSSVCFGLQHINSSHGHERYSRSELRERSLKLLMVRSEIPKCQPPGMMYKTSVNNGRLKNYLSLNWFSLISDFFFDGSHLGLRNLLWVRPAKKPPGKPKPLDIGQLISCRFFFSEIHMECKEGTCEMAETEMKNLGQWQGSKSCWAHCDQLAS